MWHPACTQTVADTLPPIMFNTFIQTIPTQCVATSGTASNGQSMPLESFHRLWLHVKHMHSIQLLQSETILWSEA